MESNRVFSEQEAAEILQRAVRLQEHSSQGQSYTPGITAEELRKIAAEAGIDVQFVDKAISGIETEETSKPGPFNLTEEFTRVVEGEIAPEDFDKVMALFTHAQKNGLKQIGRSLSGPTMTGPHMMQLSLESRNGRTKISTKYIPVFAYLMGLHAPLIVSIIIFASQIEGGRPWLGAGLAAGVLGLGVFAFRALVKAGRKAVKTMTGRIADVVQQESDDLRSNLSASRGQKSEPIETRVQN